MFIYRQLQHLHGKSWKFWQLDKEQGGLFTPVMVGKAAWACGMNMAGRQLENYSAVIRLIMLFLKEHFSFPCSPSFASR